MPATPRTSLSESLQDYLEAVYFLIQRNRVARIRDIAAMLGVGKSSVTGAVQALAQRGLVNYGPYQFITLTEAGEVAGRDLVSLHEMLKRFLTDVLGVAEAEAESVGCKMEHAIKGDVLERFVRFVEFVERRRAPGGSLAGAFRRSYGRRTTRAGRAAGGRRKAQGDSCRA
jgi:DtxR family Mn-dependent transcriptional regulator